MRGGVFPHSGAPPPPPGSPPLPPPPRPLCVLSVTRGEEGGSPRALSGRALDLQRATGQRDAFAHPDQPESLGAYREIEAHAPVLDPDPHALLVLEDLDRRLLGVRVPDRALEGLL